MTRSQPDGRSDDGLNAFLPMFQPPVLYGLLTAEDVAVLKRRRERFATLLWSVAETIPNDVTPQGAD